MIEWRDDSVRHTTSPLAAIAYGKLSFHVLFQFSRPRPNRKIVQPLRRVLQPVRPNPLRCFAFGACGWPVRISLVWNERGSKAPPEKFRHRTTIPILLRGRTRQSLGKRRQRAHRRRFARPPRILNRAGLRAAGAANVLTCTACLISRNENDSARLTGKSTPRSPKPAADSMEQGKVLNLCKDSKRRSGVTFSTTAKNKFIICLRLSKADRNFRTTYRHYADK